MAQLYRVECRANSFQAAAGSGAKCAVVTTQSELNGAKRNRRIEIRVRKQQRIGQAHTALHRFFPEQLHGIEATEMSAECYSKAAAHLVRDGCLVAGVAQR